MAEGSSMVVGIDVVEILQKSDLSAFEAEFRRQRIDSVEICKGLTDSDLTRLGLKTIGERARFRRCVTEHQRVVSTGSEERRNLFMPSRSRQQRGEKRKHTRTWTANILCLSDIGQMKVPGHAEKVSLRNAGLGLKKVTFDVANNEQDVHDILQSDKGFPKLKDCGGFEMMYCSSNCRDLQVISCKWDVEQLKCALGPQSRIYIRPIQRNLEVDDVSVESSCQLKVKCASCEEYVNINNLRIHVTTCYQSLRGATASVNLEAVPTPSVNLEAVPMPSVNLEAVPTPSVNLVGVPTPNVNLVAVPTPNVNLEAVPTPNVNLVAVPMPSVNLEAVPTPSVNLEAVPTPNVNLEAVPTPSVNLEAVPTPNVNLEAVPTPNVNLEAVPTPNVNLEAVPMPGSLDTYHEYYVIPEETTVQQVVASIIKEISDLGITDPIDCLRYIQERMVTGRKLEFTAEDILTGIYGDTSYIIVDRNKLLTSAIEEVSGIVNLRNTLEVQFSGEAAEDYGGPRREFFSLVPKEIKQKYLDPLREWAPPEECECVGKILALSMLQNGRLPRVFSAEMLENMFGPNETHPVLLSMKNGMDALGICELIHAHPFLIHLMTPGVTTPLTFKKLTNLLEPDFSAVGSNRRTVETAMFQRLVKYLRELAGGRRGELDLGYVLKFVTGSEEEPPLGFVIQPSISFQQRLSFLPTANVCINKLYLTIANGIEVPNDETLFGDGTE